MYLTSQHKHLNLESLNDKVNLIRLYTLSPDKSLIPLNIILILIVLS